MKTKLMALEALKSTVEQLILWIDTGDVYMVCDRDHAAVQKGRAAIAALEADIAHSAEWQIGMRDAKYVDSTPRLHIGSSSFEDWFQAHAKACNGDKQLARDSYAAGMGDPLVTYAAPGAAS